MQPLDEGRVKQMTDAESLIDLVHDKSFVRSVRFDGEYYSSFNCTPQILIDMHRFCVLGNLTWVVDTTFQVADKLWLTDSSYERAY